MNAVTIVVAEDDDDDYYFLEHALREAGLDNPIQRAVDGEDLMDLLQRRGVYADALPLPAVLLLDLRMPKKSGWEALREIKSDALLRRIPVVVLTSSGAEEDIERAYDLGCNTFVKKPDRLEQYGDIARAIRDYWLKVAMIPQAGGD